MLPIVRECSNCDHWRRGRRRWDSVAQANVWDDRQSEFGTCHGVEPSTHNDQPFPTTHEDDRCPSFRQK